MSQQVRGEVLNLQPTTLPATGNNGDVRQDVADGKIKKWDDGLLAWVSLGGGAGGIAVEWGISPGSAPLMDTVNNQPVFVFEEVNINLKVFTSIRVPSTYQPGTQIFMRSTAFSQDVGSNVATFSATIDLFRPDTSSFTGSPVDSRGFGGTYTSSGTAGLIREVIHELTDSAGLVDAAAVQPGDLLILEIRVDAFTLTDNVNLLANDTQVEF